MSVYVPRAPELEEVPDICVRLQALRQACHPQREERAPARRRIVLRASIALSGIGAAMLAVASLLLLLPHDAQALALSVEVIAP